MLQGEEEGGRRRTEGGGGGGERRGGRKVRGERRGVGWGAREDG